VGDRDTLTSVAARFDTTPSELKALNHLGGSFIYSGQTLLVPDKTKLKDDDCSSEASGDTDGSKDKSRKSSSNTDDIPQQEKGWLKIFLLFHFLHPTPSRVSLFHLPIHSSSIQIFEGQRQFTTRYAVRQIDFQNNSGAAEHCACAQVSRTSRSRRII
jgi:LysM domain